ncbi:MAG: hypothetical protein OER95_09045 [Acidimicrobiia bacterium]|nr:hypothetical protein [Acidimicrobiia bacterium]
MTKFDMAVLVVTDHDALSLESTDQRIQRILHAAGFLEARLAPDRVCLLVEDAVSELQAPPVTQIRYPTGNPSSGKGELIKFIQAQYPRVHRDLHRQVPIREQAQSTELRVPWAMLIAVALAALIPIVLIARSLTGDDSETATVDVADSNDGSDVAGPETSDDSAAGSATAESNGSSENDSGGDSGSGLQLGESQEGTAGAGTDDQSGGDGSNSGATGGGNTTSGGATNSSSPRLNPPGDGDDNTATTATTSSTQTEESVRLPSTCTINVRQSLLVPTSIECDDGGRLTLEGYEGPWHNEISEVALATGATGTLFYEPGSGATEQALQAGNIRLDEAAAAYGVNTISVTFSAEGQHLHLYQAPERGGSTASLFFTLD